MLDVALPNHPQAASLRLGTATLRAAFVAFVFAGLGWSLYDLATREIKEVRIHGALSEAERNEVGAAASAAIVAGRRSAADIVRSGSRTSVGRTACAPGGAGRIGCTSR